MGNKVIEYIIGAKDRTGGAIKSALARVKDFASKIGSNLMNIQAGFSMLGTAAHKAMAFMRKAFEFERTTVQFKTLIGSMDEAREHMKMLQDMGDTPPFSLEEFAAASRSLMVMTDGVLGFRNSLELCGDAAAATGRPIQELAHEVGRAYAIIRDGQPLSRATMALRNMGVLTPEVAARMDELQKAGASNAEIWNELENALKRYKGAMEETEQTGSGLVGAISAQWDDTLREFGEACLESAKDGLGALLEWIKRLREDGTIAVWADSFAQGIQKACDSIGPLLRSLGKLVELYADLRDWMEVKGAQVGAAVGTMVGGAGNGVGTRAATTSDVARAWREAGEQTLREQADRRAETIERESKARASGVEREARRKANYERKEAEENERKQKSLEEGQRKIDERRAIERAKAEEDEARKAAQEAEAERQREEAERLRMEERIHAKRVSLMRAEMDQRRREAADAQTRLAAAESDERRAWGWYRDRDAWKAQLQEERDEAEAQKQFDKDFADLKNRHRDWRTAKLSDDEEIVKRVALAREEKAEAQEYAAKTAEAAEQAANALDRIQDILEGGE